MNRTGMGMELEREEGRTWRMCQDPAGASSNAGMQVLLTGFSLIPDLFVNIWDWFKVSEIPLGKGNRPKPVVATGVKSSLKLHWLFFPSPASPLWCLPCVPLLILLLRPSEPALSSFPEPLETSGQFKFRGLGSQCCSLRFLGWISPPTAPVAPRVVNPHPAHPRVRGNPFQVPPGCFREEQHQTWDQKLPNHSAQLRSCWNEGLAGSTAVSFSPCPLSALTWRKPQIPFKPSQLFCRMDHLCPQNQLVLTG